MKPDTYSGAGVDIDRGDRFVDFIRGLPSEAISRTLGGFSGELEIDSARFPHPVLMTTTDGVGTKLLVASRLGQFDTIGIDLVAMCVNDILVSGAEPLVFLDYIACGRIDEDVLHEVMRGIVRGCEMAGCRLSGGETAELPDMYRNGEFDLAGFAVGVAERGRVLPKSGEIQAGDVIMGLPSVGIHSNGLTLARRIIPENEQALWQELLRPTKIYSSEMRILNESGLLRAAAHVTGGGLSGNLSRVIPQGLRARFDRRWPVPGIFEAIQRLGRVDADEMERVFNMGIGVAFVVAADSVSKISELAAENGFEALVIGELLRG